MLAATLICGVTMFTACTTNIDNPGTKADDHGKKALLIILDGWGIGDKSQGDVITQTATPYIDYLKTNYPNSELQASGGYVGLPDGQMGNSETGHLNIGAGRIVYQDLVKINLACTDNSILENPEIKAAYSYAKSTGKNLHLMGLTSTGGIHSSLGHLLKLIDIAQVYDIPNCYVHCFMDGRDTDPRSGKGFIADVQRHMDETGTGGIASVIGRYYAMDRDKNWDRIKLAYDLIVNGKGREVNDMVEGVQSCYDSHSEEHKNTLQYYCMTPYDDSFTGVHILFPKDNLNNTLGEYIASKGLKQLHIAETEKYAHVTSFLNGGREEPFAGEERILVHHGKSSREERLVHRVLIVTPQMRAVPSTKCLHRRVAPRRGASEDIVLYGNCPTTCTALELRGELVPGGVRIGCSQVENVVEERQMHLREVRRVCWPIVPSAVR